MSGKYQFTIDDFWHVVVHAAMCFGASAPAVIYVHGKLDWVACQGLAISSLLFVVQSASQRWLKDNNAAMPGGKP